MKKSERLQIINWSKTVSNDELEKEYYNTVFNTLGSQAEKMYDLDYAFSDIKERELYEKFLFQKCALLEELCVKRGIILWVD